MRPKEGLVLTAQGRANLMTRAPAVLLLLPIMAGLLIKYQTRVMRVTCGIGLVHILLAIYVELI